MDFESIETLACKAKVGDKKAKEELIKAFRPFIINFSKKAFIPGYEISDVENECYRILLKSLAKYDTTTHKFVAYGTNSIKNGIYDILRRKKKSEKSGSAFTIVSFDSFFENSDIDISYIDPVINCDSKFELTKALDSLNSNEKELIDFVYYRDKTLKEYSKTHGLNYNSCVKKRKRILSKLSNKLLN